MQDLRGRLGTAVDRVFYKNERLIVKRGGEPKAVLIPLEDFERLERLRNEAWDNIFAFTKNASQNAAQSGLSESELQCMIDETIDEVRTDIQAERTSAKS